MRNLLAASLICLALPAAAQDQTLADIRQELSVLFVEIQSLKRELSTTGGVSTSISGDTLQRVDEIERQLRTLTAKTEELEFRVSSIAKDGANRIGDLEFRVCELEPGCDFGELGDTLPLGGSTAETQPATNPTTTPDTSQLAVGEQGDFERAFSAYEKGDFQVAADQFLAFDETYPGSPLSIDAKFYRGEALRNLNQTPQAARAYLDAFSSDPNRANAAMSLVRLGQSLGELGQRSEACVTLAEVGARFPGTEEHAEAEKVRTQLGCA